MFFLKNNFESIIRITIGSVLLALVMLATPVTYANEGADPCNKNSSNFNVNLCAQSVTNYEDRKNTEQLQNKQLSHEFDSKLNFYHSMRKVLATESGGLNFGTTQNSKTLRGFGKNLGYNAFEEERTKSDNFKNSEFDLKNTNNKYMQFSFHIPLTNDRKK
jgi:hypothetical protein